MKADVDISGFWPQVQVILRAFKKYGLFAADNGSNWYFGGTEGDGWNNSWLSELKTIPAGDFEAVHESGLQIRKNSGKAR